MSVGLRLQDVSLAIGGRVLVQGLSLTIAGGQVTTLMGPSGSGKSALLDFVGGHLEPAFAAQGRVGVDGRDVTGLPAQQRRIGVLFQDDLLFPHLTVGQNLAFGLANAAQGRAARRARVQQALLEAGLEGLAERDPATLSGGQRARVALLRALLAEPRVLLLDEPFSKLDTALRQGVRRFVFAHAAARGLPVLLVTHDRADADAASGPVLTLGDNAG